MQDNLEQIRKLPLILEAERLFLDEETLNLFGKEHEALAHETEKKIFVYRIVYKSQGHRVIGYIAEPREDNNLPCVIWNRGGSRDFGAIKRGHLFLDFHKNIASFATRGYITIATQYSGNAGGEGKDEMGGSDIEDVLNLYKILKGYKRANVSNLGMFGTSRGGLMTYLSLAKVKWIKAAIALYAPADEVNSPKFRKDWAEHQKNMYGGSMEEKKKRSALLWANKFSKKTPLLIMHGTADWRVNPLDSMRLAEKLYGNKIPHRLIMYEGADHGLNEYVKESDEQVYEWFERFLKRNEKLPDLKPHGK